MPTDFQCVTCGLCFTVGDWLDDIREYHGLLCQRRTELVCRDCGTWHRAEHFTVTRVGRDLIFLQGDDVVALLSAKAGPDLRPVTPDTWRCYRKILSPPPERERTSPTRKPRWKFEIPRIVVLGAQFRGWYWRLHNRNYRDPTEEEWQIGAGWRVIGLVPDRWNGDLRCHTFDHLSCAHCSNTGTLVDDYDTTGNSANRPTMKRCPHCQNDSLCLTSYSEV